MRIKRQRRKLRGKYSGNCLSCSAKWSKCWYIASVDNQLEWETRLNKVVTPCDDEVCFQCWDAKIRTSPKRKIHFKAELPALTEPESPDSTPDSSPSLRPAKRLDRNKRRALSGDFEYTIHASEFLPKGNTTRTLDSSEDEDSDQLSDESDTSIYEESVIFDEENAVILLSTAFRTIPHHHIKDVNINININTYHGVNGDDFQRGAYSCGKLKRAHDDCDAPSPPQQIESQPSSPVLSLLPPSLSRPTLSIPSSLLTPVDVIALAQPVVS